MLFIISLLVILIMGYLILLVKKYKNLNEEKMSYVATLTHDLKSPTYAQINMLNLLLKGKFGQLNPKQYEMLELTCSSAKYISNLVGTVLSGYKILSNSFNLTKINFDLVELLGVIIKNYELIIAEHELKIDLICPQSTCIINADKLQIERVIMNLLSNAIIYGLKNTIITINLACTDKFINFTISNKSHYISDKELKGIFNKFSRTSNSKINKYSTGLGLYSAKHIISMHGGKMFAHSTPDGTCTFGFQLAKNTKEINLLRK